MLSLSTYGPNCSCLLHKTIIAQTQTIFIKSTSQQRRQRHVAACICVYSRNSGTGQSSCVTYQRNEEIMVRGEFSNMQK